MKCTECGDTFDNERGLKTHIGLVHTIEPSEEKLRELYFDKKMCMGDIRSKYGFGDGRVRELFDKYNIEKRSNSEQIKLTWKNADKRRERFSKLMRERDLPDSDPWTEGLSQDEYEKEV